MTPQPQVGDGDDILAGTKTPRGSLGLLQQPVHGLDVGVAAIITSLRGNR